MAAGEIRDLPDLSEKQINRFWSKVHKVDDGCWVWTGTIAKNGYGRFWVGKTNYAAHRIAYMLIHSERPDPEMTLDHTCEMRNCVLHLRPATHRENILRGQGQAAQNRSREKCIHGHSLTGSNLYLTTNGKRECITCRQNRQKKHQLKKENGRVMTYR